MIHLHHVVVALERLGRVRGEVVRAAHVVGRPVGHRIECHQLQCHRIEPRLGNDIACKRRSARARPRRGVVNGDEAAAPVEGLREVAAPLEVGRDRQNASDPGPPARALIGEEEERPVAADRSTQRPAEHVIAQRRLLLAALDHRREEIRRVEHVVPEVLQGAAPKIVGAGLRGGDDDAAGRSSGLRRIAVGQNFHLFHGVHRRIDVDLTDAEPHVLTGAAVDPEHLTLRSAAGQTEVRLLTRVVRHEHRGPSHLDEVHGTPISERHGFYRTRLDELVIVSPSRRYF